jgi:DNA-binding CsgD family transcriptional regulator
MNYNIDDLYSDVTKVFHNKKSKTYYNIEKDLPKLIKQFERLIKPDFIYVLNLRNPNKNLVFEKNYTITSDKGEVTLNLIMNSTPPNVLEKIIEIDKLSSSFTAKEYRYPFQYRMNVGFPVNLNKDKFQYFLRTAMVISLGEDGLPYHALGFLRDVSPLCRNKMNVEYFISGYDIENKNMVDFKNQITQIINYNLSLTKQEKIILKLIQQGETSLNISEELNISKSTVDTHRQNIIKKLGVKNSAAAVKKSLEFGII